MNERHDVVQQALGVTGRMNRDNVRVCEFGDYINFAEEPLAHNKRRVLGTQDLYCHLSVGVVLGREVRRGHSPPPDLPFDRITVRKRVS